ncbi:hypothetical protein BDN72DRAFT_903242 [Pluteus cervinus]|uniref:Uncharacterized protein n=1 Tax=Pluteus cervinus TaxID=181527 RepID=A0ACD3A9S6_9AGAR|nr:hypothetical protein BDN72DRAFT_903242 [Pluteus cervinus]
MPDPRLPPELERLIFIYAFHSRVGEPTNLFLVAKRVREWLLPLAFEVVLVHRRHFFPFRFYTQHQFAEYGTHIQHLMILYKSWPGADSVNLDQCLGLCPNVSDLSLIWNSPPIRTETLLNLSKLTHLSIDIRYLLNLISSTSSTIHTPLFPNITHFDAIGSLRDHVESHIIALDRHLPDLTHIAFVYRSGSALLQSVLRNCKRLEALVWWNIVLSGIYDTVEGVDDDRVVTMATSRLLCWKNAMRGGLGMWDIADDILKKRAEHKRAENRESL